MKWTNQEPFLSKPIGMGFTVFSFSQLYRCERIDIDEASNVVDETRGHHLGMVIRSTLCNPFVRSTELTKFPLIFGLFLFFSIRVAMIKDTWVGGIYYSWLV